MRQQLRRLTASAHARVDDGFSVLDLADRRDYVAYLSSHFLAYDALRGALPQGHWLSGIVTEVHAELRADLWRLAALGALPDHWPRLDHAPHPMGVAYVLCGSHFGKAVLRRAWQRSGDDAVLSAGRYLTSDVLKRGWEELMRSMALAPADPDGLDAVVAGAEETFVLFEKTLQLVRSSARPPAHV